MSDHEAIERMKYGDIGALEELVLRYQVKAVRTAFLISEDHALAEDIVQTAFIRAYERIEQFDVSRPFGPWFLRLVVNDTLKAVRRSARTISLDTQPGQEDELLAHIAQHELSAVEQLEEQLDRYETNEALASAMSRLPAEQRAALVLRYYAGLNDAEISTRLNCTPGTVRWRLYRARERLRHLLWPLSTEQSTHNLSRPQHSGLEIDSTIKPASNPKKGDI